MPKQTFPALVATSAVPVLRVSCIAIAGYRKGTITSQQLQFW